MLLTPGRAGVYMDTWDYADAMVDLHNQYEQHHAAARARDMTLVGEIQDDDGDADERKQLQVALDHERELREAAEARAAAQERRAEAAERKVEELQTALTTLRATPTQPLAPRAACNPRGGKRPRGASPGAGSTAVTRRKSARRRLATKRAPAAVSGAGDI